MYSSYCDIVGMIAPNLIKLSFFYLRPNMKQYADITEFHLKGLKIYLSTILDGYVGDIDFYLISGHLNMELVVSMLDKIFAKHQALNACDFHTVLISKFDLSECIEITWHFSKRVAQMKSNAQSLSGDLLNLIKTKMFYSQEYKYHNLQKLTKEIA